MIVISVLSMWLEVIVHGLEPLVEGEHSLDVTLTDTALGGNVGQLQVPRVLALQRVSQLPEGKVSHLHLTRHNKVCQASNLEYEKIIHLVFCTNVLDIPHHNQFSLLSPLPPPLPCPLPAHLRVLHFLVDHLHLGIDVVPLLVLVKGPVVPHQQLQGWVQ